MGGSPVDLSAIEDLPKSHSGVITPLEIDWFVAMIGRPRIRTKSNSLHWSTKSGPNGPALQYALTDLLSLRKTGLLNSIQHFLGDPSFLHLWLETIDERWDRVKTILKLRPKEPKLRKLSVKADRESKSRVFAILDWWSQSALKELHNSLYRLLKGLPADCTFDQGRHLAKMAAKYGDTVFFSFDLTNATDRFPLWLQKELLAKLTDYETAEAWAEIMVKEPFDFHGRKVFYNTGQPMGAHSSWAMFALAHHLVVAIAAKRVSKPNFADYAMLGDDIVIFDSAVAESYRSIIQDLGVEISDTKTHVSIDAFEFAKRWFYKGQEVTPYPITGLTEVAKNWALVPEFLNHQVPMKGYKHPVDFSAPVWSALSLVLSPYERHGKALVKRIILVSSLPNQWINKSEEQQDKLLNLLLETLGVSALAPSKEIFADWLASVGYNLLREEIVKRGNLAIQRSMTWRNQIYDIEDGTTGETNPQPAPDWVREIPLVRLIRDKAVASQVQLNLDEFSLEWKTFWSKWRSIELMFLPRLNGILPERARDRMSKSQSYLGIEVLKVITTGDVFEGFEKYLDSVTTNESVEDDPGADNPFGW